MVEICIEKIENIQRDISNYNQFLIVKEQGHQCVGTTEAGKDKSEDRVALKFSRRIQLQLRSIFQLGWSNRVPT